MPCGLHPRGELDNLRHMTPGRLTFFLRLSSTVLLWALMLATVLIGWEIGFFALVAFMAMRALWEYYHMLEHDGIPVFTLTGMICAAFLLCGGFLAATKRRIRKNSVKSPVSRTIPKVVWPSCRTIERNAWQDRWGFTTRPLGFGESNRSNPGGNAEKLLGGGLEPPCLAACAPQTHVSAISPPERGRANLGCGLCDASRIFSRVFCGWVFCRPPCDGRGGRRGTRQS